jgi:ferrous iron transport protein A
MSLARAPLAKAVRIIGLRGTGPLTYRLMEMGLIEGALVRVLRRAPLGDPLQVSVGDYELSLRSRDAELIDIVEV